MELLEGFKRFVESPWSPDQLFLPARRTPELSGNSPEAYRQLSPVQPHERLTRIIESEAHTRLSRWSDLYQFSIPAPAHSPEIAGGSILHLSDVHFLRGDPRPLLEMQHLLRYLRHQQIAPDIIVLTGDVITKLPDDLCETSLRLLRELSELGGRSLFVRGNHDYHGKEPEYIARQLQKCGFIDLTGEMAEVPLGRGSASIYGIDDAYFGTPRAPGMLHSADFNVTLVHNLDAIRRNFPGEMDLILSGHTHWGELNIPFSSTIKPLNGMWWMGQWGYSNDLNQHTRHWDQLTDRALSFVHPGLARYYVPRMLAHPPGFVYLSFVPPITSNCIKSSEGPLWELEQVAA